MNNGDKLTTLYRYTNFKLKGCTQKTFHDAYDTNDFFFKLADKILKCDIEI